MSGVPSSMSATSPSPSLSRYEYDPSCRNHHTFLKVPFPIGRSIAVSTEEERGHRARCRQAACAITHLGRHRSDKPKLLCTYHVPHSASPYNGNTVRFGTHQLREKVDRIAASMSHGSARACIFDIHDPANPKELGYFIPKPADDVKAPLTNDVYQDDRGLLIVTDKWRGMDVIEFTG